MLESESSIIWATVKERMVSILGKVEAAYSLLPSAGSGTEDLAGRGTKIMFCQDNRHLTRGRGELHVFFLWHSLDNSFGLQKVRKKTWRGTSICNSGWEKINFAYCHDFIFTSRSLWPRVTYSPWFRRVHRLIYLPVYYRVFETKNVKFSNIPIICLYKVNKKRKCNK